MSQCVRYFEQIPDERPIFLYGTGAMGAFVLEQLRLRGYQVAGFIDSARSGSRDGLPILSLEAYVRERAGAPGTIVVASMFAAEIAAALRAHGIKEWYEVHELYRRIKEPALNWVGVGDPHARPRPVPAPHSLEPAAVVETVMAAVPEEVPRFVLNLGCNDGRTGDPTYPLLRDGYRGLLLDAYALPALFGNLPDRRVAKLVGFKVGLHNIANVLRWAECPQRFAFLKIDIDSLDGPILAEILKSGYRPEVITLEINNDIPPPLKFSLQYHPRVTSSGAYGFYGCSLSYATALGRAYGYELLQVDLQTYRDATLVRREHLARFDLPRYASEREAFLAQPKGFGHLCEIGIDTEAWRQREDFHALLCEVWQALVLASQVRYGTVLPFVLTL